VNADPRNLVIGAVLVVLVGSSWWLIEQSRPKAVVTENREHIADYFLEGLSAIQMDVDGIPAQRLTAQRMTHYPDDDSTELTQPRLTMYDEDKPPWRIKAKTGWVSGDGEVVLLQGEVSIDRSAVPGVKPIHIDTRDLRVQPRENYVETDADIHIKSDRSRLQAKGMQGWFSKPIRLKLLANVRGYHEAN
jgi:lipopolysaccharide export system protein LptC